MARCRLPVDPAVRTAPRYLLQLDQLSDAVRVEVITNYLDFVKYHGGLRLPTPVVIVNYPLTDLSDSGGYETFMIYREQPLEWIEPDTDDYDFAQRSLAQGHTHLIWSEHVAIRPNGQAILSLFTFAQYVVDQEI